VPGALLAHDRQDGAGDIHRADEERPQLPVYLLRRQLLEVAGKEVAGIVDQDVDAAEPVDGGPRRRRGVGAVGDVQLEDQQVARLSVPAVPRLFPLLSASKTATSGTRGAHRNPAFPPGKKHDPCLI
jgi:hypothetical protein